VSLEDKEKEELEKKISARARFAVSGDSDARNDSKA
jgi:hypothetical protein